MITPHPHLEPQLKHESPHIYFTSFHSSAPNVWLHSPVGRAPHRHRGGHEPKPRRNPDPLRPPPSNCPNWKAYCDDHSSLSSTTAVQI